MLVITLVSLKRPLGEDARRSSEIGQLCNVQRQLSSFSFFFSVSLNAFPTGFTTCLLYLRVMVATGLSKGCQIQYGLLWAFLFPALVFALKDMSMSLVGQYLFRLMVSSFQVAMLHYAQYWSFIVIIISLFIHWLLDDSFYRNCSESYFQAIMSESLFFSSIGLFVRRAASS